MTENQLDFSSTFVETSLIYFLIGLIVFLALMGLIILLNASCCCFCFYSSKRCFHHRRYSSYQLNSIEQRDEDFLHVKRKKLRCQRRSTNDFTDFSQLYDSCPHLINSKLMINTERTLPTTSSHSISFISSSFEKDRRSQSHSPCTNIYDSVYPQRMTATLVSPSHCSTPIYESEWRANVPPLPIDSNPLSVMKLSSTNYSKENLAFLY